MTGSICQELGPHTHESFSDADGNVFMSTYDYNSPPVTAQHSQPHVMHTWSRSHMRMLPPVIDHVQALLGMSGNHRALQVGKAKRGCMGRG